jgi:hypothetical protein
MKAKLLGMAVLVFLAGTTVAAWSQPTTVPPKQEKISATVFAVKDGLMAIDLEGNQSQDQIAVIDPAARSVAVYQIDKATGEIALKSVRKIHWDLQLDDYNGSKPIVRDIRSTVEKSLKR